MPPLFFFFRLLLKRKEQQSYGAVVLFLFSFNAFFLRNLRLPPRTLFFLSWEGAPFASIAMVAFLHNPMLILFFRAITRCSPPPPKWPSSNGERKGAPQEELLWSGAPATDLPLTDLVGKVSRWAPREGYGNLLATLLSKSLFFRK